MHTSIIPTPTITKSRLRVEFYWTSPCQCPEDLILHAVRRWPLGLGVMAWAAQSAAAFTEMRMLFDDESVNYVRNCSFYIEPVDNCSQAKYVPEVKVKPKNVTKKPTGKTMVHAKKNAQLVTNLQQTCSKLVRISLLQDLFALVAPSLLTSCYKPAADLLQAWWTRQPCYKLFQQLVIGLQVNKLWVTNLVQLDKITALLQLVDMLVMRSSWERSRKDGIILWCFETLSIVSLTSRHTLLWVVVCEKFVRYKPDTHK